MARQALAIVFFLLPLSLALAQTGGTNTRAKPYDISAVKDWLSVIHDGQGHYVVLAPLPRCGDRRKVDGLSDYLFYGDGKTFYRLPSFGGGADCGAKRFNQNFWDPRIDRPYQKQISFKPDTFQIQCRDRITTMQELPAQAAKAMLDSATFNDSLWDRKPHRLARDDRGQYYLVDVRRDGSDHRMWIGPRGNMKRQKMRNIVADSEGEIYATSKGELRLIFNKNEIAWIRGKKRLSLVNVPVMDNVSMIYNDLGVYDERLGTPCDDL